MPPRGSTGEEDPGRRSVANASRGRRNRLHLPGNFPRLILKPSLLQRQISVQSIGWIPVIDPPDNVPVIAAARAAQPNNRAGAVGNAPATPLPSASASSQAAPTAAMATAA